MNLEYTDNVGLLSKVEKEVPFSSYTCQVWQSARHHGWCRKHLQQLVILAINGKESITEPFEMLVLTWVRQSGHNLQAKQMVVSIIVVPVKEKVSDTKQEK